MNDFEWDALQKKRIAAGARHMRRGSKSKKCALPSDYMTQAEWRRRNGKVSTYNLNQPMNWTEFRNMPVDLQQGYIESLQRRFVVPLATISRELFGKSTGCLRLYCDRYGIKYIPMRGCSLPKGVRAGWDAWLESVAVAEEPKTLDPEIPDAVIDELREDAEKVFDALPDAEDYDIVEEIPDEIGKAVAEAMKVRMTDLTATFKGVFDTESFLHWVSKLPMPEGFVKIRVEVETL